MPHVVHIITGLNDGGAEGVLYRLCANDTAYRHTVISLMDLGKYGPLLEQVGIQVHCLHMARGRVSPKSIFRLWRLLRQLKPDVVQTWMYHADLIGGLTARAVGLHHVIWNIRLTEPGRHYSKRSTRFLALLCARLSRWVPASIVSCAVSAVAAHAEIGYSQKKIVVIPNGYDFQAFKPDHVARLRLRREWGVPDDALVLGMVGRFDPQKDHENLLAALCLLKERGLEFRCVLVGKGMESANQALQSMIQRWELQDHVIPIGPHSDIPAVMNSLDIHVLSSAMEGFPNVIAEAMACGTPCVTTEVGDAPLIVGSTGWIVPPRDSTALADGIQQAVSEWEDAERWGLRRKATRERVLARFSLQSMIRAYHLVWAGKPVRG